MKKFCIYVLPALLIGLILKFLEEANIIDNSDKEIVIFVVIGMYIGFAIDWVEDNIRSIKSDIDDLQTDIEALRAELKDE